ncbi:MAG: hypothetical protein GWO24_25070, partial [Akkermansiaceae bacterium]|nr:hypothetical protein [Akkermansiaceae bacterium]
WAPVMVNLHHSMKVIWSYSLVAATLVAGVARSVVSAEKVEFEEDIRPILEANCVKCHGEEKQKGKLRLDAPAHLRKGGDSGE